MAWASRRVFQICQRVDASRCMYWTAKWHQAQHDSYYQCKGAPCDGSYVPVCLHARGALPSPPCTLLAPLHSPLPCPSPLPPLPLHCAAELCIAYLCMCAQATSALVELVGARAQTGWLALLLKDNAETSPSDPFGLVAITVEHVRARLFIAPRA